MFNILDDVDDFLDMGSTAAAYGEQRAQLGSTTFKVQ